MKSGSYFQSNPPPPNSSGSYYSHQSKTYNPYTTKPPSYEFGHKMNLLNPGNSGGPQSQMSGNNNTKVIHNGIRLVGLAANSPKSSKWNKNIYWNKNNVPPYNIFGHLASF